MANYPVFLWIALFVILCVILLLIRSSYHTKVEYVENDEPIYEKQREEQAFLANNDPPEIKRLAYLVEEYQQDPLKWHILINIGEIYRTGAYPRFRPSPPVALECFKVASLCPNGQVSGIAQSKYIETRTEPISFIDQAGTEFPPHYGYEVCRVARDFMNTIPYDAFETPKYQHKDTRNTRQPRQHTEIQVVQPIIWSSSQNVHDHSIVSITKKAVKDIGVKPNTREMPATVDSVRNGILESDLSPMEKSNAIKVLESLQDRTNETLETSELEALYKVWSQVNQEVEDIQVRSNVKETLYKQLASGVEHGHVVCSTGKITRIVGALDGVEEIAKETSRPMYVIREELANLANKIRHDILSNSSENDKEQYESGNHKLLEEKMTREFEASAKSEYIDKLDMDNNIIAPLIDVYKQGF